MLADTKTKSTIESFAGQWLRFNRIPDVPISKTVSGFSDPLRASALEEARLLAERHFTADGNALEFLSSASVDIDDRLAAVYGYPTTGSTAFRRVPVKPGDARGGLLGTAGFFLMTSALDHPSVIEQGLYVRNVLLCDSPPAPSAAIAAQINSDPKAQSSEYRLMNPACAVCHKKLDLIGKGLAAYNVFGARDPKIAVGAAQGTIVGLDNSDFSGPAELAKQLQATNRLPLCLVQHTLTWLYGRGTSSADDAALAPLVASLANSNFRFKEVLATYFASDAFIYRKAGTP
jgi:hypothetical protein